MAVFHRSSVLEPQYASGNGTAAECEQKDEPLVVMLEVEQAVVEQVEAAQQAKDSFPDLIFEGFDDDNDRAAKTC